MKRPETPTGQKLLRAIKVLADENAYLAPSRVNEHLDWPSVIAMIEDDAKEQLLDDQRYAESDYQ